MFKHKLEISIDDIGDGYAEIKGNDNKLSLRDAELIKAIYDMFPTVMDDLECSMEKLEERAAHIDELNDRLDNLRAKNRMLRLSNEKSINNTPLRVLWFMFGLVSASLFLMLICLFFAASTPSKQQSSKNLQKAIKEFRMSHDNSLMQNLFNE